MPRTGQPTKFNEKMKAELVKMISAGNYIETAASFVGISQVTFRDWIRRGEREAQRLHNDPEARPIISETPFKELSEAIKQAQAESEIRDVMLIGRAASEQWQAAAWRLERRYPDRWGKKDRHEVSGPNGGPVQFEEIRERLLRKLTDFEVVDINSNDGGELLHGTS
jgi:transposase